MLPPTGLERFVRNDSKPQRGELTKPRPTAWVSKQSPSLLLKQALQGRNNQALDSAARRLRCVECLVTPLQGWRIARHRIFTQAVDLGFVRPPLWGLRTERKELLPWAFYLVFWAVFPLACWARR